MEAKASTAAIKAATKWNSDDMNDVGVTAVNRALSILEAFAPDRGQLTLAELALLTGLYKSTILRLMDSLMAFGYVHKNGEGKYALGVAPLKLAAIYQAHFQPSEQILTALRELSEATTESASFYVINGKQRLCAYRVNSARSIRDHVQVGQLLPLSKGAAGSVLRAFSGDKAARLKSIRSDGFAVSVGERDSEVAALAAPVFNNGDRLQGALCVSGPVSRFSSTEVETIKLILLQKAAELTLAFEGYEQSFGDTVASKG